MVNLFCHMTIALKLKFPMCKSAVIIAVGTRVLKFIIAVRTWAPNSILCSGPGS